MRILFAVLLAALLLPTACASPQDPAAALPENGSGALQRALAGVVTERGMADAIREQRMAIALVVLGERKATALAMINGHHMMYAASLPKIAILYGAAVAVDQRRIVLTPALDRDINDMIRLSCNACSNRVLDAVGRNQVLALLEAEPWSFYDRERGGGLWIGKDYSRVGAFRRDPLNGFSHGATAWQVARWYYHMFNGDLAGEVGTALMLEALEKPGINHKLVRGLNSRSTSEIYRKSGSWREYHADSALVVAGEHRYIMVVLVRDSRGERWIQQLAPALHDLATR
jgi:beta-lactamase class A